MLADRRANYLHHHITWSLGGGLAQRQIRSAPTVSVPLVLLGASTNSLFDGIGFVPVCE
jgi:hypothetical protein